MEPNRTEGVSRSALTVVSTVDSADAALADSLGWQHGVAGAEVHLLLHGTAEWITGFTDSSGTVQFERLLPGAYRAYGGRTLTESEAERAGGVVRALGDGRTVWIGGKGQLELSLFADRPGSLVISEIGNGMPLPWETNVDYDGMYFEVFNNSDSTLYLDGKLFGATPILRKETSHTTCAESEPLRTDPDGVPARFALAFPGSGTDYPIGAGEVRTVAMAAVDHTPVHWSLLDLSNADFEIGGARNANNPAVPDMQDVGLEPFHSWPGLLMATHHLSLLS